MRRALALIVAIAVASPAHAWVWSTPRPRGRVAVTTTHTVNTSETGQQSNFRYWTKVLDLMGVDYDVYQLPAKASGGMVLGELRTEWARTGVFRRGGTTRQYQAVIHIGFSFSGNTMINWRPDSLLLQRTDAARGLTWPEVDQLYVINTFAQSGAIKNGGLGSCLQCSTGTSYTIPGAFNDRNKQITASIDGTTLEWKDWGSYFTTASAVGVPLGDFDYTDGADSSGNVRAGVPTGSVTRSIVDIRLSHSMESTGQADNAIANASSIERCLNCDGRLPASRRTTATRLGDASWGQYPPDTSIFWERRRGAPGPRLNSNDGRIFIVWPNSTNSQYQSIGLMMMALAALDSSSYARDTIRIIGQRSGWTPPRIAIHLQGGFARSDQAVSSSDYRARAFGTPGDSTVYKAMIDSLAALDVPMTVDVNASDDSLEAFAYQYAWWRRIPQIAYAPAPWVSTTTTLASGTGAGQVGDVNSARDLFGTTNPSHWHVGQFAASGNSYPLTTDESYYAKLVRTMARMERNFPGRVARTLIAPSWDYIPARYNNLTTLGSWRDSMLIATWRAGIRSVLISADVFATTPNSNFVFSSGPARFGTTAIADPAFFGSDQGVYPVYDGTTFLGNLRATATRGQMREPYDANMRLTHNWNHEFLLGLAGGPWYIVDMPNYYHNFRTSLGVFTVPLSVLGNTHASITGARPSPGWWQAKWLVNQMKAVNHLAGRQVVRFVHLDEL